MSNTAAQQHCKYCVICFTTK